MIAVSGKETEKAPVIVMSEPVVVMQDKISFYVERNLDADCSIVENGILLHTGSNVSLENYTHKAQASSNKNQGQFTIRKANVAEGETWYAVSYMIYKDKDGKIYTAYSNEVSKTR